MTVYSELRLGLKGDLSTCVKSKRVLNQQRATRGFWGKHEPQAPSNALIIGLVRCGAIPKWENNYGIRGVVLCCRLIFFSFFFAASWRGYYSQNVGWFRYGSSCMCRIFQWWIELHASETPSRGPVLEYPNSPGALQALCRDSEVIIQSPSWPRKLSRNIMGSCHSG